LSKSTTKAKKLKAVANPKEAIRDLTKAKSPKAKEPIMKRPKGRPSDYSVEMATQICSRMAEGKSLRSICEADDMPDKSTVFRWLHAHEEFQDQYARAMAARTDAMAEELLEIADDGKNDTYTEDDGHKTVNHDHIQRSRLRVDTRKWLMARMAPKKYGDRVTNEMIGDKDNPLVNHHVVQVEFVEANGGPPANEEDQL
jgi:hypothetical protein